MKWILLILGVAAALTAAVSVMAADEAPNSGDGSASILTRVPDDGLFKLDQAVDRRLRTELARRFPGARIEVLDSPRWAGPIPEDGVRGEVTRVTLLDEDGRGQARFSARIGAGEGAIDVSGTAAFAAFLPARVATSRILPGAPLLPGLFTEQDVNIASGQGREYRGLILPASAAVQGLQARQTIVAGQFLVSSAVERIPDVRRGDSVRIRLVSGGLILSAAGVAEEPGYIDGRVRVMSSGTRRELVGRLLSGGVVEVRL